ncbi:MAG: hypothetical protein Q7T50_05380 [Candidatus Magasanikbacteria bacterium]|nr:hypothetical protein [Candidatus Magasanikbacteria bacterium]
MKFEKFLLPSVILLIAIIICGGYYFSQISKQLSIEKQLKLKIKDDKNTEVLKINNEKQKQDKEIKALKEKNTDCEAALKISKSVPFSYVSPSKSPGLSTYTNMKNDFKIDFPDDYILDLEYESEDTIYLRTQGRQSSLDQEKMIRVFDVMIRVFDSFEKLPNNKEDKLAFEDWINQKSETYGFVEKKPILVDGIEGYSGISNGMIQGNYMQFFEYSGKIYEIENEGSGVQGDIIKSFRFIK